MIPKHHFFRIFAELGQASRYVFGRNISTHSFIRGNAVGFLYHDESGDNNNLDSTSVEIP